MDLLPSNLTPSAPASAVRRTINLRSWAVRYARIALGTAFLSAVAARFGLWHGTFDLNHFSTSFFKFAAEVLSFLPASWIPVLAVAATIAETVLGILLVTGLWLRWVSLASSFLLLIFAVSMAISYGLQSPMDYSVFSASSAALLLATHACRPRRDNESTSDGEGSLKRLP